MMSNEQDLFQGPATKRIKLDETTAVTAAVSHQPAEDKSHDKAILRQQHKKDAFCPLVLDWKCRESEEDGRKTVTLFAIVDFNHVCLQCHDAVHRSLSDHCLDWYHNNGIDTMMTALEHARSAKRALRVALTQPSQSESASITELLDTFNSCEARLRTIVTKMEEETKYHLAFQGLHVPNQYERDMLDDGNNSDMYDDEYDRICYNNSSKYKDAPDMIDIVRMGDLSEDMLEDMHQDAIRAGAAAATDLEDKKALPHKINLELEFVDDTNMPVLANASLALAAIEAVMRTPLKDAKWSSLLGPSYTKRLASYLSIDTNAMDTIPCAALLEHNVVAPHWMAPTKKMAKLASKGKKASDKEIDSAIAQIGNDKNIWRLAYHNAPLFIEQTDKRDDE